MDQLFGLKTSTISVYYLSLIKNLVLLKNGIQSKTEIKLKGKASELIPGLKLLNNLESGESIDSGVVVGTIRMGYGHHRMAYSVYTHLLSQNVTPHLHDILAIDSKEASAIKEVDSLYSYWSRLSSEMGGVVEWLWGQVTSQGNINSLLFSTMLAEQYENLASGISHNIPYISTYPLNGQIAVAHGIKKVINLIPDNFPQYYLLVPNALNLVQSPASYIRLINMGIPKENIYSAGHWVSEEILRHLDSDTQFRLYRIENKSPRRYLLPIGGAGAQRNYIIELINKIAPRLKQKQMYLFLNTGDHEEFYKILQSQMDSLGIEHQSILNFKDLSLFREKHLLDQKSEPNKPVIFFNFKDYYSAFTATDLLVRISDVLITKPSELAFYPIPKVFIRRVGDHEASSAFRSMELGEGTIECREVEHAKEMIELFSDTTDIISRMNECISRNHREKIYSGSQKAVELAMNS